MGTINRVTIMGIIGQAPELKWTRNGKPFVRLSLATHKRTKDDQGNARRETQWHSVMLWGKNAEICSTYCEKGAPIYIEGHLAPYTKEENGEKSYHLGVNADQIQFIPGTKMAMSSERGEFEGPSLSAYPGEMASSSGLHEENPIPIN
jgi:single-strand DNA-binding protein